MDLHTWTNFRSYVAVSMLNFNNHWKAFSFYLLFNAKPCSYMCVLRLEHPNYKIIPDRLPFHNFFGQRPAVTSISSKFELIYLNWNSEIPVRALGSPKNKWKRLVLLHYLKAVPILQAAHSLANLSLQHTRKIPCRRERMSSKAQTKK